MMTEKSETVKLDISLLAILKVFGALVVVFFAYLIRDVFALLFIALVLSSLIDPFADYIEQRKIPRAIAVLIIYVVLFGILVGIVGGVVPLVLNEVIQLSPQFGNFADDIFKSTRSLLDFARLAKEAMGGSLNVGESLGLLQQFLGIIAGIAFVLALTFYLVVEEQSVRKFFKSVTPRKYHDYFGEILPRVQEKMGKWLRAQMMLGFIIFILVYTGLSILGVKYALTMAVVAGLAEFIPYIGPILSAIPAIMLAATNSILLGVLTLIMYVVIQWLENHILVPKVMQKVIGINPVISIIAFLVGGKIYGIVGAVLAIPVVAGVTVFTQDFFAREEKNLDSNAPVEYETN